MNRRRLLRLLGLGLLPLALPTVGPAGVVRGAVPGPQRRGEEGAGESEAAELMRRVNRRDRGFGARMRLHMALEDARRGTFTKDVLALRRAFPDGYRTSYRIREPEHEEGIALLLSEDPEQRGMWMYFPANGQLLRVASRGLSALASDFSCEDLRVSVPLTDYRFRRVGSRRIAGRQTVGVEMLPAEERLALELGFSRSVGWVREDAAMIVRAEYEDPSGAVFKVFEADDIRRVDGVWTAGRFAMRNLRARHATVVTVTEVDYSARPRPERFVPESFHRPAPP